MRNHAEAIRLANRVLEVRKELLGETDPDYPGVLLLLGRLHGEQGRHTLAEPFLQQAVTLCAKALGRDHPDHVRSLHALASCRLRQGDVGQAEGLVRQAWEINKQAYGEKYVDRAAATTLAFVKAVQLCARGQGEQARAALEQMLPEQRKYFGPTQLDLAYSLELLAELHEGREDYLAAARARKEGASIRAKVQGEGHWEAVNARLRAERAEHLAGLSREQRQRLAEADRLHARAAALAAQGKRPEAVALAEQALRSRRELLDACSPECAASLFALGRLRREMGDPAPPRTCCSRRRASAPPSWGAGTPTGR